MAFALGVAESRLADSYNLANTLPIVALRAGAGRRPHVGLHPGPRRGAAHEGPATRRGSSVRRSSPSSLAVLVGADGARGRCVAPLIIELFTSRRGGRRGRRASSDLADVLPARVRAPDRALRLRRDRRRPAQRARALRRADVRADPQQPRPDRGLPRLRRDRLGRADQRERRRRPRARSCCSASGTTGGGGGDGGGLLAVRPPAAGTAAAAARLPPPGRAQAGAAVGVDLALRRDNTARHRRLVLPGEPASRAGSPRT